MSVTVVGVDPSLRRTGLARITVPPGGDPVAESWACPTIGHRNAPVSVADDRMRRIVGHVAGYALPCALAAIEGPSHGSAGSAGTWDRAGLWWRIVARLLAADIPVAIIPPKTRAKWACGNGNGGKADVRDAITATWRGHWTPTYPGDDNEADALTLASMAAQWLDWLPLRTHDRAALDGAHWPDRDEIPA